MATNALVFDGILAILRRALHKQDPSGTFTLDDYLHSAGRAMDACMYFALFCPALVEVDESVLLRRAVEVEPDEQRFREYKAKAGTQEAERSFNFVEVPYLFGPGGRNLSDAEDHILAEALALSWKAWLSLHFPGRHFAVQVVEPDQTGSVIGVQFFELLTKG